MGSAADTIVVKIDQLKELKPGWDSYDADTIELAARQRAQAYVVLVEQDLGPRFVPPTVGATTDGGVTLIWRRPTGRLKLEAFFSPAGEDRYIVIHDRKLMGTGALKGPDVVRQYITT